MNYKLKYVLAAGISFILLNGCIKEEPENCGKYLWFENPNPRYSYPENASDLLLLVYDSNGRLADEHTWSGRRINELSGWLFVSKPPAYTGGSYTMIALFNIHEKHFLLEGIDSFDNLKYSLLTENDSIKQYFHGNAYALKSNILFSDIQHTCDTLKVSKNSNYIDLDLTISNYTLPEGSEIIATLSGTNTIYNAANTSIDDRRRIYMPYEIQDLTNIAQNVACRRLIKMKTMRIWRHDGLHANLWLINADGSCSPLEISLENGTKAVSIEVTETIAKITDSNGEYMYDTYEKLECEDRFKLELTLEGSGLALVSLSVNGWMLVANEINM